MGDFFTSPNALSSEKPGVRKGDKALGIIWLKLPVGKHLNFAAHTPQQGDVSSVGYGLAH